MPDFRNNRLWFHPLCAVLFLCGGATFSGWAGSAALTSSQPGSWLPLGQRPGGPLPLSVQNEVDAAVDRARLWLAAELGNRLPLRPGDAGCVAWPLTALMAAADPAVKHNRNQALREWLALREDHNHQTAPNQAGPPDVFVFRLDALALAGGLDPETEPNIRPALRGGAEQALNAAFSALPEPDAVAPSCAGNQAARFAELDLHLDNLEIAGMAETVERPTGPAREDALKRIDALLSKIPAGADAWTDGHDERLCWPGFLRLRLFLGGLEDLPFAPEALARELSRRWRFYPDSLTEPPVEGAEAWRLVRLLNQLAPARLLPWGETGERMDWRLAIARQLVSAQRIDPDTGSGFWGPVDGTETGAAFQTTALCVLILETL